MTIAHELFLAVLLNWPMTPARECIMSHQNMIEDVIHSSINLYPSMPPEMIVSVGFHETHLGCARNEGGNWGAPISPQQRHIAGTPIQAARALWRSYEVCGNWEGAARRFRTGLCNPRNPTIKDIGERYGRSVIRAANSLRMQVSRIREADQSYSHNNIYICG